MYKIRRLIARTNTATGAVEGILAAATLYTLAVTLINCCLRKKGAPKALRWLLIALDLAFMGAFIAVAALTRPNGESPSFWCILWRCTRLLKIWCHLRLVVVSLTTLHRWIGRHHECLLYQANRRTA